MFSTGFKFLRSALPGGHALHLLIYCALDDLQELARRGRWLLQTAIAEVARGDQSRCPLRQLSAPEIRRRRECRLQSKQHSRGMASALPYVFYLQIQWIWEFIAPGDGIRVLANWAHFERVPGTNPERSERVPCASAASPSGWRRRALSRLRSWCHGWRGCASDADGRHRRCIGVPAAGPRRFRLTTQALVARVARSEAQARIPVAVSTKRQQIQRTTAGNAVQSRTNLARVGSQGRSSARYRTLRGPSGAGGTIEQWLKPTERESALGGGYKLEAVAA